MRIVYLDDDSIFEELLERDNTISRHHKNLQLLALELFKCKNNLSNITKEVFIHDENLKTTRQTSYFRSREIRTVFNGEESLGPKIWEVLPEKFKEMNELESFNEGIKHWKPTSCPCRNCRTYINGVGFL